jgi:hypothetical protein
VKRLGWKSFSVTLCVAERLALTVRTRFSSLGSIFLARYPEGGGGAESLCGAATILSGDSRLDFDKSEILCQLAMTSDDAFSAILTEISKGGRTADGNSC